MRFESQLSRMNCQIFSIGLSSGERDGSGSSEARLIIKSQSLADPDTATRYLDMFAGHGIEPGRLDLLAWINARAGHLDAYRRLDIALDPFPYNGTTTTFEALWMGVPVITLAGDRHAARVGASILTHLGLDHLVAGAQDAYVEAACALAGDPARRASLRASLRDTLAASALCDGPAFARQVEAAYRNIWGKWCAGADQRGQEAAAKQRRAGP